MLHMNLELRRLLKAFRIWCAGYQVSSTLHGHETIVLMCTKFNVASQQMMVTMQVVKRPDQAFQITHITFLC